MGSAPGGERTRTDPPAPSAPLLERTLLCDCEEVKSAIVAVAEDACTAGGDGNCHAVEFSFGLNSAGACAATYSCRDAVDPDNPVCATGRQLAAAPGSSRSHCAPGAELPNARGSDEDVLSLWEWLDQEGATCKLAIGAKPVEDLPGDFYHLFLVLWDRLGTRTAIQGDAHGAGCWPWLLGCVRAFYSEEEGITVHRAERGAGIEESTYTCRKLDRLLGLVERINAATVFYDPYCIRPDRCATSNSVPYTLLLHGGFSVLYPEGLTDGQVRGWGNDLLA